MFNFLDFQHFFKTHFPSLHLVQFSATQFQIWDTKNVIWGKIEVKKEIGKEVGKNSFKITSIEQKSKVADTFQVSEIQEFVKELDNLATEFNEIINSLLETAKKDFVERKKEIENQFRAGFSTKQKEDLQPIIQLLEEGGHSIYLLSEWITVFEFWKVIYQNNQKSSFKKSFFARHEITKSLSKFLISISEEEIPTSYSELGNFVNDFCQTNKIKESELLLYGIFDELMNNDSGIVKSKLDFIPIIQQKINQSKPKKIWINDNLILKSLEYNSEKLKKRTLFGTFENFADLLLGFSTQNETSQFAFETKKPISQVGIFGLSKNSELVNKLEKNSYDLIILNPDNQNLHSVKEISLFQSLSKKDKQLFASLQNSFKSLSESGILVFLLDENQNYFIEKKSLASLRRLLQEWFERIEVYQNETDNQLGIIFYKKTGLEKGVFYSELTPNNELSFQTNFLPNTWKPKPVLSEYQKLIPTIGKNSIFKTYFRAIPNQKIENFVQLNSDINFKLDNNKENNLKIKVKEVIQNHNQQILKSEEKEKGKLEKKKNVLVSKLATNTLFEKDTIKVIEEKIVQKIEVETNHKTDNKILEFEEKNLIETQVSVFEEGFWYYEKSVFEDFYDLDKIFPNRKQGENILIFWANTENGGEVWAIDKPIPPVFLNEILSNSYIFPFYVYDKTENGIKKKINFSKNILHKFKRGYAAAFEKRVEKTEDFASSWFDFSDFEFLQVNQELAFELQALSSIMNEDESKIAKEFRENLHTPKQVTYTQFDQIRKVTRDTKRAFERLESKAARNKESFETLKDYFRESEKAIDFIESYWQKLEAEEASNFVVPTEENMTDELILGYIFGVWQRDVFKSKYKEELKNEAPRIPIYKDFHHFANQGNYDLQKFLKENKHSSQKIEFEIVEVFEEKVTKNKKSSKIWFEKDNKVWYDNTTFLQLIEPKTELDYDTIKSFEVNQKSFFELTLKYLRKNKVNLNEGKEIIKKVVNFIIN